MNALTLKHPWPYAIARLGKDLENRRWTPPPGLLAPGQWFAFHGGAYPKGDALEEADADLARMKSLGLAPRELAVVGDVVITGVFAVARYYEHVSASPSPWFSGPYAWTWSEIVVLPEPVPCRGAQKLWRLPDDVLGKVREQFKRAQR